jgi:hypothetical protein
LEEAHGLFGLREGEADRDDGGDFAPDSGISENVSSGFEGAKKGRNGRSWISGALFIKLACSFGDFGSSQKACHRLGVGLELLFHEISFPAGLGAEYTGAQALNEERAFGTIHRRAGSGGC